MHKTVVGKKVFHIDGPTTAQLYIYGHQLMFFFYFALNPQIDDRERRAEDDVSTTAFA